MKNTYISVLLFLISFSMYGQDKELDFFYENGILNLDSTWNMEDYNTSAAKLLELLEKGRVPLPKYGSPSYEVLLKISDGGRYFEKKSEELNIRFQQALQLQESISNLGKLYLADLKTEKGKLNYGKELLLTQSSMLHILKELLQLTEDFLSKNPDLSETQKEGLLIFKAGMGQTLKGGLITIFDEYGVYHKRDLCTFSDSFFSFYEYFESVIDAPTKEELRLKIKGSKDNHKLKCVRKITADY